MTVLTDALFRIEPTRGLVSYTNTVKPFHTKILDVLVEYVYAEDVKVQIKEKLKWDIILSRPDTPLVYTCGYGIAWDPVLSVLSPDSPLAPISIISATHGLPVSNPLSVNSNSFLIQPAAFTPFTVTVSNVNSNQFAFTKNYTITAVDLALLTWSVTDPTNQLVGELTTGTTPKTIFITNNTGSAANKSYTVASATHTLGITTVTVVESIPPQAVGNGTFHRVKEGNELPQWAFGQGITFNSVGGILPTPLVPATQYYFNPTPNPGFFNVSTVRYPTTFDHIINVGTIGTGTISVVRSETMTLGSMFEVTNTFIGRNNGRYIVKNIKKEGANERIYVYQSIPGSTPLSQPLDGLIKLISSGYDDPQICDIAQAPDLYINTFFHETLKFDFVINLSDTIEAAWEENRVDGYGTTLYSSSFESPFGAPGEEINSRIAATSGSVVPYTTVASDAHSILPTGFDTQLFDIGGIDETVATVRELYAREAI